MPWVCLHCTFTHSRRTQQQMKMRKREAELNAALNAALQALDDHHRQAKGHAQERVELEKELKEACAKGREELEAKGEELDALQVEHGLCSQRIHELEDHVRKLLEVHDMMHRVAMSIPRPP